MSTSVCGVLLKLALRIAISSFFSQSPENCWWRTTWTAVGGVCSAGAAGEGERKKDADCAVSSLAPYRATSCSPAVNM